MEPHTNMIGVKHRKDNKMNKLLLYFIIFYLFIGKTNANETFPAQKIYMEVWFPFQYLDEANKPQGFAVDLLDQMLKDLNSMNSKNDFIFAPWARIISNLKDTNTIVLSMIRMPERENRYQWVGPIYSIDNYVIVRNDSPLKQESFTEGNNITAAGIIGDASLSYLEKLKVNPKNIHFVSNPMSPILMLHQKRVDIVVDNWFNFEEISKSEGLNLSDFKRLINLGGNKTYFAVSKSTDPSITSKLQNSLDRIRASPQYENLLKKYNLDIESK